jgi:SAM-dependent methyltransferase
LTRQVFSGAIAGLPAGAEFLQLSVGRRGAERPGPGWTVVDLDDPPPAVAFDDDKPSLPAEWASSFALGVCNAVLEHLRYPQCAVDELYRVLKPGAYVYLEVAFWQPYRTSGDCAAPGKHGVGGDYWRATVEGLRVWAAAFEELSRGWAGEGVVYFFGRKPTS